MYSRGLLAFVGCAMKMKDIRLGWSVLKSSPSPVSSISDVNNNKKIKASNEKIVAGFLSI
jgi:hypothetical protein